VDEWKEEDFKEHALLSSLPPSLPLSGAHLSLLDTLPKPVRNQHLFFLLPLLLLLPSLLPFLLLYLQLTDQPQLRLLHPFLLPTLLPSLLPPAIFKPFGLP